ncbi:TonB-dependent receptor [Sphingomonas floccifaciens]|uniref:TonB-dependent receptor n=1 Tax=Sphingomonas floccifaciens TaxID=1844115 RepID=A0ABW4NLV3_9SPHN
MIGTHWLRTASVLAIVITAAAGAPALAQESPIPASGNTDATQQSSSSTDQTGDVLPGDIVVTAQRRAERLQDVPISITAVSGADLQRLHADNVSRLEFIAPGFTWGSQGADSFPAIRGVRTSLVSAQNDPVIGFYIDGVYQSRTQQQSIPLFDIARVEVQRGPQGTLYGRNTFGGNLSVVTASPTDRYEGGLNVDFGNYNSQRIDGFVNAPLSDTLALRVAGVYQDHDGYVRSTSGVEMVDLKEYAGRASLRWTPDSRLEVELHGGFWRRDDAGAGSYGYKVAGTLINPQTGYQSINGVPYAVNPSVKNGSVLVNGVDIGVAVTPGAYTNDWDYQPFERIRENYVSGTVSYDLGAATVRSITGYTFFRAHRSADNDQSSVIFQAPAQGFGSGQQEPNTRAKTFTQELQLVSNSTTPFQWIVGGYYLNDDIFETYQQKIDAPGSTVPGFRADAALKTNAYAAYAQGTYALIPDKLRIIGGIRYSHEKKSFDFADFADGIPNTYTFTTPYSVTSGAPSFDSVTWRAGLQFTPTRATMVYATASTGFASGGVNDTGGSTAIPNSYAPQKVDAYEAGIKNQFLNGRVQTELALYYNRYSNLQINVYTPQVSYFGSAGRARSYGGEVTLRTLPLPNLHVDATLAYLNAEYTRYISGNNFFGASNGADPVSLDLAGKRVPQSPRLKTTLAVYYDIDLGRAGTLAPYANWLHSSSYFTTDYNTVLDYQRAYDKFDVSLRWTEAKGKFYVEGYGNNVTDKAVLLSAVVGRAQRVQVSYGPPATYGIRAGVKF